MKLTGELVQKSEQYLNPLGEFHLNLRGYKITLIENLSATHDQFGSIDFCHNEIASLPEFPSLPHLRTLLLSHNRISKIDPRFAVELPRLESLVLADNKISNIREIDSLAKSATFLKRLVLAENPVSILKNYRLYTIFKIPNLRFLDYQKVTQKQREESKAQFEDSAVLIAYEEDNSGKNLALDDEDADTDAAHSIINGNLGIRGSKAMEEGENKEEEQDQSKTMKTIIKELIDGAGTPEELSKIHKAASEKNFNELRKLHAIKFSEPTLKKE